MVKHFPEFRRQVDDTTRRASRQRRTLSTGGTGRPCMALDSRTPTPEKGARARSCESFPCSFAGRSIRPPRIGFSPDEPVAVEKRRAGTTTPGLIRGTPAAGNLFSGGAVEAADTGPRGGRKPANTTALTQQAAAPGPRRKPAPAGAASRPPEFFPYEPAF